MGADSAPLPCKAAAKPPQRACPEFAKMETKGLFPNFGVFKVPFTTKNALACCTFATPTSSHPFAFSRNRALRGGWRLGCGYQ